MKSFKPLVFIFLLLLLVASGDGVNNSVEARSKGPRLCESRSRSFKGMCVSDHNCANVCRHERFYGGHCRGFRQRCFCTQPCK